MVDNVYRRIGTRPVYRDVDRPDLPDRALGRGSVIRGTPPALLMGWPLDIGATRLIQGATVITMELIVEALPDLCEIREDDLYFRGYRLGPIS
jgi:hypothetical protein